MLPHDVERCAGFAPGTQHDRCPRRPECGRFLSPCGPQTQMAWSACEEGDGFIHVATVAQPEAAAHPQSVTPAGVTALNAETLT